MHHRQTTLVLLAAFSVVSTAGCELMNIPGLPQSQDASQDSGGAVFATQVHSLRESQIIDECSVKTGDPDESGTLDRGEVTTPDPEFTTKKDTCSEDVDLRYRLCFVEKGHGGKMIISTDITGAEMCGDYETRLDCVGQTLVQGETRCVGGRYCDVLIRPVSELMECGWQVVEFAAYNSTGELLEEFTDEALEEFGFEVLPVETRD